MARQGLISGVSIRREAGRYLGRRYVLPREALLLWHRKLPQVLENRPDEENPKRRGTEGGRFTRSTEDARPMKPGNRVEGKTLLTGKEERGTKGRITENPPLATVNTHLALMGRFRTGPGAPVASSECGKAWTKDDGDAVHEPK